MNGPDWLYIALEIAGIVGGLVSAAVAVTWFVVRHTRLAKTEFDAFCGQYKDRQNEIDGKLAKGEQLFREIDGDIDRLPSTSAVESLRVEIARLEAIVTANHDSAKGRWDHLESQIGRLIDWHLRNPGPS